MEMDKVAKQATNIWNQTCHFKNQFSNNKQKGQCGTKRRNARYPHQIKFE